MRGCCSTSIQLGSFDSRTAWSGLGTSCGLIRGKYLSMSPTLPWHQKLWGLVAPRAVSVDFRLLAEGSWLQGRLQTGTLSPTALPSTSGCSYHAPSHGVGLRGRLRSTYSVRERPGLQTSLPWSTQSWHCLKSRRFMSSLRLLAFLGRV